MESTVVTRFAPSPTGWLHLGHAHAALRARDAAGPAGRFLLRIEDIDPARCRPEFAGAIGDDLGWLGLRWDGPVRVQSACPGEYRAALDALDGFGLLYPCFCTRAAIAREVARSGHAPHGPEGAIYPGTCRRLAPAERSARLAAGEAHALRLDVAAALRRLRGPLFYREEGMVRGDGSGRGESGGRGAGAALPVRCDPARFGDVVLARKDAPASYHLCATHDDARQGVTLVTRGEDLRDATDLHRLLQEVMGWPEPRYNHHPLLHGPDGRRLSKRDGALPIRALREAGLLPAAVRAMAGVPDGAGEGSAGPGAAGGAPGRAGSRGAAAPGAEPGRADLDRTAPIRPDPGRAEGVPR